MIVHLIRVIFVLAVVAISFSYANTEEVQQSGMDPHTGRPVGMSPDTKAVLVILIPFLLAIVVMLADLAFPRKSLGGISGLFFGLVVGIAVAYILGMVVELGASVLLPGSVGHVAGQAPPEAADQIAPTIGAGFVTYLRLLIGAFAIYICVSFVLQTKDDFRFIIPYVEFARERRGARPILLDTSVIIDGRIADIADTQILESRLIVPRFVLEEIQNVADSADKLKRNRGRRGLDMLNRLRTNEKINIELTDLRIQAVQQASDVDQKLVALAQHLDGRVVTNDYNLNKICRLRGVDVININDLANALKPVVLPGENVTVKIVKPGEEMGQGVGYLDDGTMVVAEQGRDYIGRELTLVVTSVLQTAAGRMIFGKPDGGAPGPSRPRR